MKRHILISMMLLLGGMLMGQNHAIPCFPIPSWGVCILTGSTFREAPSFIPTDAPTDVTMAKREVIVRIKSASGKQAFNSLVWVYSLDRTTIKGPYTIDSTEPLAVEIDEREWGLFIESKEDIVVDVWIEEVR